MADAMGRADLQNSHCGKADRLITIRMAFSGYSKFIYGVMHRHRGSETYGKETGTKLADRCCDNLMHHNDMESFDDLTGYLGQFSNPMEAEAVEDVDALYLYNGMDSLAYTRETAVPQTAGGTAIACSDYRKLGTHISMHVEPAQGTADSLLFPLFYYPGYEIRINGTRVESYSVNWLLACDLPSVPSDIQVRYVGLPVFRICDVISILTMAGIIFTAIWKRKGLAQKA